jgi:hypothetical protein
MSKLAGPQMSITLGLYFLVALFGAVWATAQTPDEKAEGRIITFDPPGSSATFSACLNSRGEIVGSFNDSNNQTTQGFLRVADGTLTTFFAPWANTAPNIPFGTVATSINTRGEITGFYIDASFATRGFLRTQDGTFSMVDVPGAGSTNPASINSRGEITGWFNESGVVHGFLRAKDGTTTAFDPPGSRVSFGQGINQKGEITGVYFEASGRAHGFLRATDGSFTEFDAPGASYTNGQSINQKGEITGVYSEASGHSRGFLRATDGSFTVFDAPGAATGICSNACTFPKSINRRGEITGFYYDTNGLAHGFLRASDGTYTIFDATATPGLNGTMPVSINSRGEITGSYQDANGLFHGFLRTPDHGNRSGNKSDDEDEEDSTDSY